MAHSSKAIALASNSAFVSSLISTWEASNSTQEVFDALVVSHPDLDMTTMLETKALLKQLANVTFKRMEAGRKVQITPERETEVKMLVEAHNSATSKKEFMETHKLTAANLVTLKSHAKILGLELKKFRIAQDYSDVRKALESAGLTIKSKETKAEEQSEETQSE